MKKRKQNIATVLAEFWVDVPIENGVATTIPIDKEKFKEKSIQEYADISVMFGYVQLR